MVRLAATSEAASASRTAGEGSRRPGQAPVESGGAFGRDPIVKLGHRGVSRWSLPLLRSGSQSRPMRPERPLCVIVVVMGAMPTLRAVRVRTLVVVGAQDAQFLEPSRSIAAAVPGARYVEIPEAGHSPQFEQPEAWRTALQDFLASL